MIHGLLASVANHSSDYTASDPSADRAHERASTMPKLHGANTVAWGLLKDDRWGMIVVSHWSKPAWQNMVSLLIVVGLCTLYKMP